MSHRESKQLAATHTLNVLQKPDRQVGESFNSRHLVPSCLRIQLMSGTLLGTFAAASETVNALAGRMIHAR